MKLFKNAESILDEIRQMEKDETPRREDRAMVSRFYNGQPPFSQKEAEALGLKVNVNNLFGYTDLATAKDQMVALYTKPPRLFNVQLDSAPIGKKYEWEQKATHAFNRAIKKTGRLRMPYEGVAGDATLHGEGEFFFPDPRSPIPRHLPLSQRLIPSKSPADVNELSHFAIVTELSIFEIMRHLRRKSEGWKLDSLGRLRDKVFDDINKDNWSSRSLAAVDTFNPEEMEYARQEQMTVDRVFRQNIPVVYFYQADPERDGRPLDLTIVLPSRSIPDERGTDDGPDRFILFESEEFFPSVKDAVQPFFMDCILGGAPKWHRIKGLGHLNYSLSWHIEVLMSRLMQGTMESVQTIWQASDGANREELEKILLRHNGIIPEHVQVLQKGQPFDFNGVLAVVNAYKTAGARNAQAAVSNSGETNGDELEVQAMFRQGQITAQQSSRLANWYDALSTLGSTMFGRYTSCDCIPADLCYSEINEFQAEIRRAGIPLYYLQPWNVNVTAYKITGDGNDQKATRAASFFMQNMAMFPAESQQLIKRIVTGIVADDYELAERLIPIDDKPDGDQVFRADGENNTAIIQGISPDLQPTDVDEVHVPEHIKGLGSLLNEAQQMNNSAFTPKSLQAFKALGGHTIAHVKRMESMGKKDEAAKLMDTINQISKMAEKFRHNLEQQQQAQQQQGEPMDPSDAAHLQLEQAKLDLAHQKQQFAQFKFDRTQSNKEHQTAIDTSVKLAQDARAEQAHRSELATRDVQLSLDVADSGQNTAGQ